MRSITASSASPASRSSGSDRSLASLLRVLGVRDQGLRLMVKPPGLCGTGGLGLNSAGLVVALNKTVSYQMAFSHTI